MSSKRKELVVEGVIFHLNPEFILFEFRYDGDESIGIISTTNLILRNGERIPRGSLDKNSISKYVEIGDEIECRVYRVTDSSKCVYVEEEKGEDNVMIKPEWTAEKAYVLPSPSYLRKVENEQDGLMLAPDAEDMDIMFGDSKIDDVSDLRTLLRCRKLEKSKNSQSSKDEHYKVPPSSSSSSSGSRRSGKELCSNSRESSPRRKSRSDDRTRSSSSSKSERGRISDSSGDRLKSKSSNKERNNLNTSQKESSAPFYRAELLAIKKPGRNKNIVIGGIMEILDDVRYSGKKAVFSNNSLYIYGHPLGRADLSFYLRKGDEFNVEINDVEGSLTIKRAWYNGGKSCSFDEELSLPARVPSKCSHFKNWLRSRDISFESFTDWVLGKTPVKPYFPFQSPCFTGVIEHVVKEESPLGDGAIVRISSEGKYKDKLVVFEKSDFYIGGVSVGNADLRILLRPRDIVNVQILEMSTADKKRYKYMTKGKDVPLCGQLCFIGNIVPKNPFGVPENSEGLKSFLCNIGLSMTEFINMKNSCEGTPKSEREDIAKESVSEVSNSKATEPPLSGPLAFIKTLTNNLPIQEHNKIMFALSLTVRALNLSSASDPKANDLLQTPEDISNAVWLSKIFTQVLINKMQTKMREKIIDKYGSMIGSTLKDQKKQITSYELINAQKEIASGPMKTSYIENGAMEDKKSENIIEMMKKVEKQIEGSSKKASTSSLSTSSSKGPKRDMKKILESYASTSSSKGVNYETSSFSPLELLYHFIDRSKTIALRNNMLFFGSIGYPLSTKTNFSMAQSRSNPQERYYTIYDLYFFWKNRKMEHSQYKRTADKEKCNAVLSDDRKAVLDYLNGRCLEPPNITQKSFEELNPSLCSNLTKIDEEDSSTPAKKIKLPTAFEASSSSPSTVVVPSNGTLPISSINTPPLATLTAKAMEHANIPTSNPVKHQWMPLQSFSFSGGNPNANNVSMSSLPAVNSSSMSSPELNPLQVSTTKPKVVGFTSSFSFSNKAEFSGTGFSSAFDSNSLSNLRGNPRANSLDLRNNT